MGAYISSYMPVHTYLSRLESFEHLRREPQFPKKIKTVSQNLPNRGVKRWLGVRFPLGSRHFLSLKLRHCHKMKYPIDIKKLTERYKDICTLTLQRICDAADVLIRKMIRYFSWIWHDIDVDFATLVILVHFLLGRHGLHSSEGEIKTWWKAFHSYTVRRYIAHITVTSCERDEVSNHRQHDCLCMHKFVQLTKKKTPKFRITGPFWGDSTVRTDFPSQRTDYPDKASSSWRHHVRQYAA